MVTKTVMASGDERDLQTGGPGRLKVALIQYACEGGLDRGRFLSKVENLLAESVRAGAGLVVFPELFTADLLPGGVGVARAIGLEEEISAWSGIVDQEVPALWEAFSAMAARHPGVAVLFGSTPRRRSGAENDIVNTALLCLPDGRLIEQDKLFLTPCEDREWKWRDGEVLQVVEAPWGRTVILICHDIEVPAISELLVRIEPDLILTPSCTGSIHGLRRVRFCAQARAVEHHAWVLQTSTVQPPAGLGGGATVNMNEHTGQAAIIPPSESLYEDFRREGPLNQPAILFGEVDIRRSRKTRAMPVVYPARDQRRRKVSPGIADRGSIQLPGAPVQ